VLADQAFFPYNMLLIKPGMKFPVQDIATEDIEKAFTKNLTAFIVS